MYCICDLFYTMIRFFVFFLCLNIGLSNATSTDEILALIGKSPMDVEFLLFRNKVKLDRNYANAEMGIKFYLSENRQKITSVLFANDSLDINQVVFKRYKGDFFFDFNFDQSIYTVKAILGTPIKTTYNSFLFQSNEYTIEVYLTDPVAVNKISYVLIGAVSSTSRPMIVKSISATASPVETDVLKNSIMSVFKASQDLTFASICKSFIKQPNIWNYTHTQSTSIHIPGELYNFVYAFPFANSQRDFVSVLAEQRDPNSARNTFYSFEQKLSNSLAIEDGWRKMSDNSTAVNNQPSAVTFSKPSLGEVILDYVKSPKGEEVVYLRFLFQYR